MKTLRPPIPTALNPRQLDRNNVDFGRIWNYWHSLIKIKILFLTFLTALAGAAHATEFCVATNGDDANSGTATAPFRTIQRAADMAQAGDVITVHKGVYRERIHPPRGGTSDTKRIVYQAAPGERPVITGSEIVKHWERVTNDTWKAEIPNSFFGSFNPYADLIHGDWFHANKGRQVHTGEVYLNGDWLTEAANLDDVLKPAGKTPFWFGEVSADITTIWAQFKGGNPNELSAEINVRKTVFTPEKTGVNYLTVRGFDLRNAATPWAPPTAAQIGLISAYWCNGWIIESNQIKNSTCCGVALGKYGDEWDNRAESAEGYVGTINRALTNGWNKATVGSHIVRYNEISHCEQTGIVGSLGCSYSTITGNEIHDIHVRQLFGGAEMSGVKFHGAVDVTISHNHIYRCGDVTGLWLDWMAQGAQVTGNLFHDNGGGDIFFEMQHGPILVANNLFLSKRFALNSQGIAFVHNLIAGDIHNNRKDTRSTPFLVAHSTQIAGLYSATNGDSGDHRFYNNLFVAPGNLHSLDDLALSCFAAGNVFTKGSQPSKFDAAPVLAPDFDAGMTLTQKSDGWYLGLAGDKAWRDEAKCKLVTTSLLGKTRVSDCAFENADGSELRVDVDYFGNRRNGKNPFVGPFETVTNGKQEIKVWPLPHRIALAENPPRPVSVTCGEFVRIYDPSVGEKQKWYINDHCFIRDAGGIWNIFGITRQEPADPLKEIHFAHATATNLLQQPWDKQPFALDVATNPPWNEVHLWAPDVIYHDGLYYMFYCAGDTDRTKYKIHLATSPDLKTWTRSPKNPMVVDGYDARDPFILRVNGKWVMYYTATSKPTGGNHIVACVSSDDLLTWTNRQVVFIDSSTGTGAGGTESPFVVQRGDSFYLFIGPRGGYDGTDVFLSDNPFHWDMAHKVGHFPAHAAEVVQDTDGKWYISRAGWGRGGVYLAPLIWNDNFQTTTNN